MRDTPADAPMPQKEAHIEVADMPLQEEDVLDIEAPTLDVASPNNGEREVEVPALHIAELNVIEAIEECPKRKGAKWRKGTIKLAKCTSTSNLVVAIVEVDVEAVSPCKQLTIWKMTFFLVNS